MPPYQEGNIRFTKKGPALYAIVLPDADGKPPRDIVITSQLPASGSSVELLGVKNALGWTRLAQGFKLSMPESLPCNHAWVIKFAG